MRALAWRPAARTHISFVIIKSFTVLEFRGFIVLNVDFSITVNDFIPNCCWVANKTKAGDSG